MSEEILEEESIKPKKSRRKINPWIIISIVLVLILAASIYTDGFKIKPFTSSSSAQQMAQKAVKFINSSGMLQKGLTATLVNSQWQKNGLCKITIKVKDKNFDSYISRDGNLLFPSAIDMGKISAKNTSEQNNQSNKKVSKRDIPDVKLFVMTYCPFGLQAQKALLPVYNLLKDKAKIKVYFVNYSMHGKKELDENLRQYCIEKEQSEKYGDYLACFIKDGKFDECLNETKIDKSKLTNCISKTDKEYEITSDFNDKSTWLSGLYPKFNVEDDLNKEYNVGGSPTLVINDVVSLVERSPEKYKEAICNAFTNVPEECSKTLSEDIPARGFGIKKSSSSSNGSCG